MSASNVSALFHFFNISVPTTIQILHFQRIPRMTAEKGQQVDDQAKELRIGKDKRYGLTENFVIVLFAQL